MKDKKKVSKKTEVNNSKSWMLIGAFLLFIVFIASISIANFSKEGGNIAGIPRNIVSAGSNVSVTYYHIQDATLTKMFEKPNFKLATSGKVFNHDAGWKFITDGQYAYCLEIDKTTGMQIGVAKKRPAKALTGSEYWKKISSEKQKLIEITTVFGYPNVKRNSLVTANVKNASATTIAEYQYMATQVIIWEIQQGWRTATGRTNATLYNAFISKNATLKAIYNAIDADMKTFDNLSSFLAETSSKAKTAVLISNDSGKTYTYKYTDTNKILSNFTVSCPSGLTCKISGNTLTVTATSKITTEKTITLTKKLPSGVSQGMVILDDGIYQRQALGKSSITKKGYIKVKTEILGSITLKKTSEDNNISNIKFTITGPNNYSKSVVTDSKGTVKIDGLKLGTYTVTETYDTSKYMKISSQKATLSSSSTSKTLEFENILIDNGKIKIAKIDVETSQRIAGAKLYITTKNGDKSGIVGEAWTTTTGYYTIDTKTLDMDKTYYVCEQAAPDGYEVNNVCKSFVVKAKNSTIVIDYENKKTTYTISKTGTGNKALAGAVLQLLDSNKNKIEEWTTDGTEKVIRGLKFDGKTKYYIREVKAPEGYAKRTDDIEIIPSSQNNSTNITNNERVLRIYKYNAKDNKLLSGATLQILDSNKKVVYGPWVTEGKAYTIKGIAPGKYYLEELKSPKGYTMSTLVEFEVKEEDTEKKVSMYDDQTVITISKSDITNGQEIAGAKLQVIDSNGVIIDEWISEEGKSHTINGKLTDGETYILRETQAPYGYVITEEIVFVMGTTEKIDMKNKPSELKVYKKDAVSGKGVAGAKMQIVDSKGKVLHEWTTSENAEVITKLPTNENLIIKELAAPKKYLKAKDQTIKIKIDEASKSVDILDTPIIDVPNTAANVSIIAIACGIILILGGVGTIVFVSRKNQDEQK